MWNPGTCSYKNGKYWANILDGSVIKCDGIIDADAEANLYGEAKSYDKETKTIPTNSN